MKKTIIICGLIGGFIVTCTMIATMIGLIKNPYFEGGMWLGYTTMLVAFSLIFVAVKNARNKFGSGFISFGKAFRIGLMITLIASTVYVLVWMIDYYFFIPDFMERYSRHIIDQMRASGASQAELQKQIASSQSMNQLYKNPIVCAAYTYLEILPVGLLVSLVCALVLKRRPYTGMMINDKA
jgi:hypothetical protein